MSRNINPEQLILELRASIQAFIARVEALAPGDFLRVPIGRRVMWWRT